MGVGFGGGFFDSSTATFQVKSGGGGTGTGPGGEEAADALLEEDESAMVGRRGKWEAFFTVKDAKKDKDDKDQQAAWAEYGEYQGLKRGKDFPRLESVDFQDEPGKGTHDGWQMTDDWRAAPRSAVARQQKTRGR